MNGYRIRSHGVMYGVMSHTVRPFPDHLLATMFHNVLRRRALKNRHVLHTMGIMPHQSETVVRIFRIPT